MLTPIKRADSQSPNRRLVMIVPCLHHAGKPPLNNCAIGPCQQNSLNDPLLESVNRPVQELVLQPLVNTRTASIVRRVFSRSSVWIGPPFSVVA